MMFHYAVALVQLLVAYYSCDFESDHRRPENDQSQSAFHGVSSGSIMRHIPVFDINMVAELMNHREGELEGTTWMSPRKKMT